MKNKLVLFFATALAVFLGGCASTPQQQMVAVTKAVGQAYGSYVLTRNPSPEYLAKYKDLVPKVAHVMQGAITPADFHNLISQVQLNVTLTPQQAAAVGFLSSINDSFVQYNGGATPTVDGALADTIAKQLAAGMVAAVGSTTGTNWVTTL
jgi:hypothetical protein